MYDKSSCLHAEAGAGRPGLALVGQPPERVSTARRHYV